MIDEEENEVKEVKEVEEVEEVKEIKDLIVLGRMPASGVLDFVD